VWQPVELKAKAKAELLPAPQNVGERTELARIREAYELRARAIPRDRYARIHAENLCRHHECEVAMANLFRAAGLRTLRGLRILDVGCGRGAWLRQLLEYNAEPSLLFGFDLMENHLREAVGLHPGLQFARGDASHLPFPDGRFDLVIQFMLFTSVLSDSFRQKISDEMMRILSPNGRILWYDFTYNNPKNPDVRGIGRAEIRRLFPGCSIIFRRVTLAPPLGRIVGRISPALYNVLAMIRPLCTHYMCLLQKR
jgi:SAM-dependent methyltransferase